MNWEVLVVGGGKIGRMVAVILQSAPEFNVTIADADEKKCLQKWRHWASQLKRLMLAMKLNCWPHLTAKTLY